MPLEKFLKANKNIDFDINKYANELNENGNKKGFIHAQRKFRSLYDDDFLEFLGK